MLITRYPAIVANEGLSVVVEPGFATRSHGDLQRNPPYIVWHHDASPAGPSPGVLGWMLDNWNTASANIWVDFYGTWHFVGAGVAWHAGATLPGMPTNYTAIGIETDYTVGEKISPVLYDSLRRGTAAIFRAMKQPATDLHFHKTICSPPGRKSDPWALDLATERNAVAQLVAGSVPALDKPDLSAPQGEGGADPREWDEMATKDEFRAIIREELAAYGADPNYSIKDAKTLLSTETGTGLTVAQELAEQRKLIQGVAAAVEILVNAPKG